MVRRAASRLGLIGTSATLAIKMEADRLRRSGRDVIDFGPGEPDLETPSAAKRAAIAAIEDNRTHYTSAAGIAELRTALAERYTLESGREVSPDEVMVGSGGKPLLFATMMSLVNPGDDVLIVSPYWVSFPEQVRLAGGRPIFAEMSSEGGFSICAARIKEALTPATRMIIVNSPANPTGGILPAAEAEALVDLVVEHDLWLISDETYESFVYDPADVASLLAHRDRLADRLVMVSAFSKTWAMTGWRVGYAIASAEVIRWLLKIQSHDTTQAASISQYAALGALENYDQDYLDSALDEYRERRRMICEGLNAIDGVSCALPRGAFYAFPDVRALLDRLGLQTSQDLARTLISEIFVATVPGEAFGAPGYLRFSYATSRSRIEEGLDRLHRLAS